MDDDRRAPHAGGHELATFTYGRKADSYISKAISLDGTIWKLVGGSVKHRRRGRIAGSSAEVGYLDAGLTSMGKEIQSEFVYTKFRTELWCTSPAAA